jgi:hypothetical protein
VQKREIDITSLWDLQPGIKRTLKNSLRDGDLEMIDLKKINDPEYRWQHKEEMSDIMRHTSKRNELGVKVLDYEKLRMEFYKKIKEGSCYDLDMDLFVRLVERVPKDLDRTKSKTGLQPADRYHFERRDRLTCYLCGTVSKSCHLHHVIPNGDVSDDNIVTLCESCHKMVHLALFRSGRWRHAEPR